jgi:2-oxoglutarate ferredoxin oxidoreductase subunit gamma
MVIVGFFGAVTNVCDRDALRKAVAASVPPLMETLNLQAFDRGFDYGAQMVARLAELEGLIVS